MEKVYLGIGTNLGDRESNITKAVRKIALNKNMTLLQSSSLYETEPYGYKNQHPFLNLVIVVETMMPPLRMLIAAKSIEEQIGREKRWRWGPREIDVDILSYEKTIVHQDLLWVPHRELAVRRFVLKPFAEIAPAFVPPGYDASIRTLLVNCRDSGIVRLVRQMTFTKPVNEETS
ncbi:MAG TPA: 2-amino-4-hydroxy-6-hydroxymethyldihydropteridine diphosphokinase [Bacteroidetes bacterium]|nr:2-amino-4-hydroxy-6-hydroxymethyldihydropteridine diphosphokinase [Bacteroidota bacterium]